ncbi:MAG: S8 family serine peptidase [Ginsengibacter sp.]
MKKFLLLLLVSLAFYSSSKAQFSKYVIRFKDKAGTPFSIANPSQFLSPRSIERRKRQNILIDETDLPITPAYIDSVILSGTVTILNRSKWLNQICIQTTDNAALAKINSFSFVLSSQALKKPASGARADKFTETLSTTSPYQSSQATSDYYDYSSSYSQIHIHEGEFLHNKGFKGEGMLIAILDAGFYHYKTITAFDSVRNNNQVAETYDFVNNETSVDEDDTHGMYCFSIIAANWPGKLVGSCPKATFYLYRTEDATSEYPVEEQNWAAAAERADSIGVDVFSTSLGYTTFNNSIFDHSYADMNGNTTIVARACDLAAKKGIISVVAAGNEGGSSWHFISSPADADSALTVGAVNNTGVVAGFSSFGPSSDGQVKPTVASVGQGTAIANTDNQPAFGSGTSFATPNMAGLVTCLWQAFPDFTNMEIIEAVKKSSSIYTTPNDRIGYGIPNLHKAYDDLLQQRVLKNINTILAKDWIKVYPNPFTKNFSVVINPSQTGTAILKLYDNAGKLCKIKTVNIQSGQPQLIQFDNLQPLATGIYILKYDDGTNKKTMRILGQ